MDLLLTYARACVPTFISQDKAVIWITHQLDMLPYCSSVAVVENGHMTHFGPYDAEILNTRLPVDHLLFATVEAGGLSEHPSCTQLTKSWVTGKRPLSQFTLLSRFAT